MKKNIYRILATAFAVTIMVASPMATITSHAGGFNPGAYDDTDYGAMPDDYWDNYKDNSSSSEPAPSYSEPETSSSSNSGSSYGGGLGFNENAHDDTDHGTMPNNYWSTVNNANNVTVSVKGGQQFRNVMNTEHTSFQVYHCGNSKVTFEVTDSEGKTVTYKTVKLEQGEDKLWYENITFADNVDTKDFTLNVTKGDATYLSTELGVSGIKINGTVVLSTVPVEPETDTVIGHRYCATCGASFDIYENSGVDDAWKTHMKEHLAKGEPARYSDK